MMRLERLTVLRRVASLFVAILSMATFGSAHATTTAWLDNNQIASGDTVQLTIDHDGQTSAQPDLAPLRQDFDVLGTSRSSNVQIVNGSVSAHTQAIVTLSPKHDGVLTVPSISWGGEQTQPLTLHVGGSGAANGSQSSAGGSSANVFVETQVQPLDPYVQGQVAVTVKLYTAVPLYQANLDFPAGGDALVQRVGNDTRDIATRNGRQYNVITRRYLVFPQHSGKVTLAGAVLDAQVPVRRRGNDPFGGDPFADFFGQSPLTGMTSAKPIRVHGAAVDLHVKPRPAAATASYWLPAHAVTLSAAWQPDSRQGQAGEPVTLTLTLQATGLTAAQLPDVASLLAVPKGVKAYPDQAQLTNTPRDDTVVGTRVQKIALIADAAGRYEIPALHVHWWNTQTDTPQVVDLPARTLQIAPAANAPTGGGASNQSANAAPSAPTRSNVVDSSSSNAAPANPSSQRDVATRWRWISFALCLLWVTTLVAWIVTARRAKNAAARIADIGQQGTDPIAGELATVAASGKPREDTGSRQGKASSIGKPNVARAAFREACRRNDAQAARRYLLQWASIVWSKSPPKGLRDVYERLGNAQLATLFDELDRACYAGAAWNGATLLAALPQLADANERQSSAPELADLYPH